MAKKKYYSNTHGDAGNSKYMVSEDMSAPSNMPRGNKSIQYPQVDCGGQYVDDSVAYSDRDSSEMAKKLKSESNDSMF